MRGNRSNVTLNRGSEGMVFIRTCESDLGGRLGVGKSSIDGSLQRNTFENDVKETQLILTILGVLRECKRKDCDRVNRGVIISA